MGRVRRVLTIFGVTLVAGYCLLALSLFLSQRSLVFPVPERALEPKHALVLKLPEGGVALSIPAEQGKPTLVFFHGNAQQLADLEWLGARLAQTGLGFFAPEYPGYGLAGGDPGPSEKGCYAAAESALTYVERSIPHEQLVLVGQSLGTGVAVEMAMRGHGSSVVLISPFTSIRAIAAQLLPFLPTRWLVRDPFDTMSKAKAVSLPVLIIHGTHDEVVPTDMGRTLARVFPRAVLMLVDGAHHNDLIDRPEVLERIAGFALR